MSFYVFKFRKGIKMDKYVEKLQEIFDEYKFKIVIGLVLCILLLVGYLIFIQKMDNSHSVKATDIQPTSLSKNGTKVKSHSNEQIFVDVKGAVKNPGVYQMSNNMRGSDAVNFAGGFTEAADMNHINLAKKVTDQEIIYVPLHGEIVGLPKSDSISDNKQPSSESPASDSKGSAVGNKVNLNDSDKTKLQTINGVGDKKADKIIDYRNQNGPFKSVDDLKNVPGFGEKTVANLRPSLAV